MRTNTKERKINARQWYSLLINSYNSKSAVVVQRYNSSNPNINRVQLLACNTIGTPVVISESIDGIRGCLYELFQNIKQLDVVKTYHENDFKEWLGRCFGKKYGKDVSVDNEPCKCYEFGGSEERLKEIENNMKR